jgi:hypothetical protein
MECNITGNNKDYLGFHVQCPILTKFGNSRQISIKVPLSNFVEIRPVGTALIRAERRMVGKTDRPDGQGEDNRPFRDYANLPKITAGCNVFLLPYNSHFLVAICQIFN